MNFDNRDMKTILALHWVLILTVFAALANDLHHALALLAADPSAVAKYTSIDWLDWSLQRLESGALIIAAYLAKPQTQVVVSGSAPAQATPPSVPPGAIAIAASCIALLFVTGCTAVDKMGPEIKTMVNSLPTNSIGEATHTLTIGPFSHSASLIGATKQPTGQVFVSSFKIGTAVFGWGDAWAFSNFYLDAGNSGAPAPAPAAAPATAAIQAPSIRLIPAVYTPNLATGIPALGEVKNSLF